ncbi:MAG: acetate--CoA ligase family protein, partial [Desulfobacterales bacterium]|nr:acetate--CoA ligase family protein [Desulfobacterales bacterium]MDX2509389.1 acetate--CoA ligase family protein [Desulfobacterales bacterium]
MDIDKLIKKALKSSNKALSESESKLLLKEYQIPVINEKVVLNKDEAVNAAEKIGFPVVVKGLGAKLLHKTELGIVHLNLNDSQAVEKAAISITEKGGDKLEGFLIQPQLKGKREFVAGLFQDDQFGPVVMFGTGGVFAEALSDVTFRIAPLTKTDAKQMLDEIKAHSLLGNFRGENAADRDRLIDILLGLSRIGMEHPEVSEIDINPLIISADGSVCAVDALVLMDKHKKYREYLPAVDPVSIRSIFYPDSIAFVGASAQIGKWGYTLLINTASGGFKGNLFLVNPKGGTIAGRQVYKSVSEIPGEIDLAVVTIPASGVMDLIPQFKDKNIKNMLLITSGFAETGEEGRKLEKALVKKAGAAGILLLGPNTMGICNPHADFYCTGSPVQPMAGSTAVVSQSGNMGVQLLAFADQQGIGIRGFCGSGNEAMVTIEDFLDGFEIDPLTNTVMLYIESVKNGRRFFESARRLGKKKPVVLLKGGQSSAGNKAASSHTGALTTDTKIFDAVCRQTGIVKVEQPMDLLDLAAAFSSLPLPKGNRAAIMTLGGGWGVVTADLCSQFGLEVPELSPEIIKLIDKILPPYWSRSNPVDLVGENDTSVPMTVIEELLKWDGCDAVINLGILGRRIFIEHFTDSVLQTDPYYSSYFLKSVNESIAQFESQYIDHIAKLMEIYKK